MLKLGRKKNTGDVIIDLTGETPTMEIVGTTDVQLARAQAAVRSIDMSVFMGQTDEQVVETAKMLLRGINRLAWSDPEPA